jgi:OmcA/MtrC family decaheme c-type cytochrome
VAWNPTKDTVANKRQYELIRTLMKRLSFALRIAASVALIALCLAGQTKKHQYSPREKAFYADPALVDFVRPGLVITINAANIASNGAIAVTYTLTDPSGLPLDAAGVTTPGAVSMTFIASYIPAGQEQYVAYTTAPATGKALGTVVRPDFEIGGPGTSVGPGQYRYTFQAQAPAGFDPTVTTTIAVNGSRDLTSFNLGTSYGSATFNFVPNGSAVTVTRDVIRTASCNTCHDQLVFHGAHAFGMEQCVLCHQPQNRDPVTGNTLDLKVMAHKIHMGSSLPSVVGTATTPGVPYQIAGYMNFISDFSKVVDPAMAQRCEVCHTQTSTTLKTTGGAQATAFLTKPTRAACGACHDDVNFATGANHAGGVQPDDNECANCHIPQGEVPFDASIMGAHVVQNDTPFFYPQNPDTAIGSIVVTITGVTNTSAGQKPTVAFTLKDTSGKPIPIGDPTIEDVAFTMAGPTTDYGYTSFGSDTGPVGYVSEDASPAGGGNGTCDANGNCTYTFQHAIPAGSTGTYGMGVESERLENVLTTYDGTQQIESGTPNSFFYFSVDGSKVLPRRTVVDKASCNRCHIQLSLHGNRRKDPELCEMCHNPSLTDSATRAMSTVPAIKNGPAQSLNFNFLVHRIHSGVNLAADGASYAMVSHGGRVVDFSNTLYPAFSPEGAASYTQDCSMCHVNGSEQNLPTGLNVVLNPQYWINPTVQPVSGSCAGCHASKAEASHFLANTDSLGESCTVCHSAGAQFAVDAVHTQ